MSIADRVSEAIYWMGAKKPDSALLPICCAIDATAKLELGAGGGKNYERFVHTNLGLITRAAFGVRIENINLIFDTSDPELIKDISPQGTLGIQHILYHAVRCGLVHEPEPPNNIKFVNEPVISNENGVWFLPASLVYGLIIAVVASPANKDEICPQEHVMNIAGMMIPIARLWGRRVEIEWFLEAVADSQAFKKSAVLAG